MVQVWFATRSSPEGVLCDPRPIEWQEGNLLKVRLYLTRLMAAVQPIDYSRDHEYPVVVYDAIEDDLYPSAEWSDPLDEGVTLNTMPPALFRDLTRVTRDNSGTVLVITLPVLELWSDVCMDSYHISREEHEWRSQHIMVGRDAAVVSYVSNLAVQLLTIDYDEDYPVNAVIGAHGSGKTEFVHQALYRLTIDTDIAAAVLHAVECKVRKMLNRKRDLASRLARQLTACLIYTVITGRLIVTDITHVPSDKAQCHVESRICQGLEASRLSMLRMENNATPMGYVSFAHPNEVAGSFIGMEAMEREMDMYRCMSIRSVMPLYLARLGVYQRRFSVQESVLEVMDMVGLDASTSDSTVTQLLGDVVKKVTGTTKTDCRVPVFVVVEGVSEANKKLFRWMAHGIQRHSLVFAVSGTSHDSIWTATIETHMAIKPYRLEAITRVPDTCRFICDNHGVPGSLSPIQGVTRADLARGVWCLFQCGGDPSLFLEASDGFTHTGQWVVPCTAGRYNVDSEVYTLLQAFSLCGQRVDTGFLVGDATWRMEDLERLGVSLTPYTTPPLSSLRHSTAHFCHFCVPMVPILYQEGNHRNRAPPDTVSLRSLFSTMLDCYVNRHSATHNQGLNAGPSVSLITNPSHLGFPDSVDHWIPHGIETLYMTILLERARLSRYLGCGNRSVRLDRIFGVPHMPIQPSATVERQITFQMDNLWQSHPRKCLRDYGTPGQSVYHSEFIGRLGIPVFAPQEAAPEYQHTLMRLDHPLMSDTLFAENAETHGTISGEMSILNVQEGDAPIWFLNTPNAPGPGWGLVDARGPIYGYTTVSSHESHVLIDQYLKAALCSPAPTLIVSVSPVEMDTRIITPGHWVLADTIEKRHTMVREWLKTNPCGWEEGPINRARALLGTLTEETTQLLSIPHVVLGEEAFGPVLGGIVGPVYK
ncbi:hypothetical protein KIPB_001337 [Kipferlia bialata]|uniref:Uncharacterized protein n=1 Tax=Kipferlia bialata TaxID=797122 RepID=A0A9K3CQE1_9EUKA|nr:hypothetical protein KIPB_001337 [Kipferlia bialata]|eukprot:g1337.t1